MYCLELTRRTARNAGEDGRLFAENQQGYVEFDLFVDSDEIADTPTHEPETTTEKPSRLAPPPPPPKPKKYSMPGTDWIRDSNTLSSYRLCLI